ncbi:hypothetical protein EV138_4181 [Kribbella voronezhensis]|uniref:Uncharacterized protein n=1 Tax=Kribbella voronezhensis TaxID=2512212 RepID=A0A4R7TFI9_9ACTN|nr:hypothetical protein [Kribbella voronezhensis]TDU90589.1 hypothetical protein EV138_4181 [Kribbella voronezhensis]
MTTIPIEARIHLVELSTEEVHRLVDALTEELRRRKEVGESPWRVSQLKPVLQRLSGTPQGRAIAEAAQKDGSITRNRVLRILGRDVDGRLNGFRKPINTVVGQLTKEGVDLPVAPFPFWVDYDGGVSAVGFYIDEASLPAVRAALGN